GRGRGGAGGARSTVAPATPEDATPPAQPRGLVAVLAGPTVRLAWQAVPDADLAGYRVYRSTTAGRGHTPLTPVLQAGTTYVDTDVRPGQTYYYVVPAGGPAPPGDEAPPAGWGSAPPPPPPAGPLP